MDNQITNPIKEIATLVKFGRLEHLKDLQNGNLFLNKISFFKDLKHDPQRADEFEGAIGRYPKERYNMRLTNPQTGETIEGEFETLYLHSPDLLNSHIFCTYAIHAGEYRDKLIDSDQVLKDYENYLKLNSDKESFGGHLLYFKDKAAFFQRVDSAVKKAGLRLKRSPVCFFNENGFEGNFPKEHLGFLKPSGYMPQNEYRILIQGIDVEAHHRLFVGDLSDISAIATIDEFNDSLKVEMPS